MAAKVNKIIGIELDENSVICTELTKKPKDTFELSRYFIKDKLKVLAEDPYFKDTGVIVNLPTQMVLLRSFHAPSFGKRSNELQPFIARQNLPFKLEECYWDTFIIESTINLIAARKEAVERFLAQFKEAGLNVIGVTNLQVALYNVFILNYEKQEKFVLLNIGITSSDLMIYESKRFWNYPLSLGKADLEEGLEAEERFCSEVQRLISSHYLQNPSAAKPGENFLYISGKYLSSNLITPLKSILGEFEILILDPLKKIDVSGAHFSESPESMAVSLGLSLVYHGGAGSLKVNLIKEKIRTQERLLQMRLFKQLYVGASVCVAVFLAFANAKLAIALVKEKSVQQEVKSQVSKMLPEVKALSEAKEKLRVSERFLDAKLAEGGLYLVALAAVSEARPQAMEIREFNAEAKEDKLSVLFSGSSLSYEEMNEFVSKLKKKEMIKEVKLVASTFPGPDAKDQAIDFNLRFEIPLPGKAMLKQKT